MRAVLNFIVKPLNNSRYNNEVKLGDKEYIDNCYNYIHQFCKREGGGVGRGSGGGER